MAEIQIKREALFSLLQDLIKIESVNPALASKGSGEAAIARYIGDYLRNLGLEVRFQEIEKNRVNVVGILKGSGGGPSLMFFSFGRHLRFLPISPLCKPSVGLLNRHAIGPPNLRACGPGWIQRF